MFFSLDKKRCVFCVNYNLGHNILRLFNALPNFAFTISNTKLDYQ